MQTAKFLRQSYLAEEEQALSLWGILYAFYKVINPIHKGSTLITFQSSHLLLSQNGVHISIYEFGMITHIQCLKDSKRSQCRHIHAEYFITTNECFKDGENEGLWKSGSFHKVIQVCWTPKLKTFASLYPCLYRELYSQDVLPCPRKTCRQRRVWRGHLWII